MDVRLETSWKQQLRNEFQKPYFQNLADFVKTEYREGVVYPAGKDIFNAFEHCPFNQVRVVILGQDPYHGPGQAHGLCFSVPDGIRQPPSLKNIFKEIHADMGKPVPESGSLVRWADQGVLLLNATLTVRANSPGSHQNRGWETFTDEVVRILSAERDNLVFLLWGAYAQRKGEVIDESRHLVLKAAHPSPFAAHRGFFGCRHFSKTNKYLAGNGKAPIDW
ncbi:MAG: uracil-DNA glycosylase [Cyclobacteriaceae bacterium]